MPPADLDKILQLYPNATEIEHLSCIDNVEWSEEIPYYFKDIRAPRLTPGASRKIFKIGKSFAVIDLRSMTESSSTCEAYLPLPERIKFKPRRKIVPCENIFCSCARRHTIKDLEIGVYCVPFFMPDGKLSVCAQSAMKIIVKHFANEYNSPDLSMPQIQKEINYGDPYGGSGLYTSQVLEGLSKICGKVLYYQGNKHPDREKEKRKKKRSLLGYMDITTLHAYIESELPVYLVFNTRNLWWWKKSRIHGYHSIIGIGHTLDKKGNLDFFLVHDPSQLPYCLLPAQTVSKYLYEALVVLPKGVNVRFEEAFKVMIKSAIIFNESIRKKRKGKLSIDLLKILREDKVVFRSMLVSSTKVKEWYSDPTNFYGVRNSTKEVYKDAELPPYVWLFELKDRTIKNNINFAQILINATEGTAKLSLINLPDGAMKFKAGTGIQYTTRRRKKERIAGDSGLRKDRIKEKWGTIIPHLP